MIYPGVTVSSTTTSGQGMMLAEGLASLGQQTPAAYSHGGGGGGGGHILENKVSGAFITRQRA